MRVLTFTLRTLKEVFRDPLSWAFGVGLPAILLILLGLMGKNIPSDVFEIEQLTPGISVFGLSFVTLFSSLLIAKDRSSALLQRLYTTPLKTYEYIAGYTLSVMPLAVIQCISTYAVGLLMGMDFSVSILYNILLSMPIALFFIGLGVLLGSFLNDKQVGGICGGVITQLSVWLSGAWFDLGLIGTGFKKFAEFLPFIHAVEVQREIIVGDVPNILIRLFVVLIYALITYALAFVIFFKNTKNN